MKFKILKFLIALNVLSVGCNSYAEEQKLPENVVRSIEKIEWIEFQTDNKIKEIEKQNKDLVEKNNELNKNLETIKESQSKTEKVTEDFIKNQNNLNYVWITIAAVLVFFMQAGFALLESGATRAKNMVNVLMKNYMDMCVGGFAFAAVGFAMMFGINKTGWIGTSHWFLNGFKPEDYVQFFFQIMFCSTAATIVSGAIAERTKFSVYLMGSFFISAVIYPIFGGWAWGSLFEGQGWLKAIGFIDFAGSTVVHSVGAWCALVAAIIIGPRMGRFGRDGKVFDIPGHNLSLSSLGTFILWFAWFGFNGGSTLVGDASIGLVVVNTHLAGCAAACAVMFLQYFKGEKILVTMVLNAGLCGLVAVTAGAATMTPWFASLTGFVAGILMYFAFGVLLKFKVDDVVGAFPVHGVGGIWGTLAAGIFYAPNMFDLKVIGVQLLGVGACAMWSISTAFLLYTFLNAVMKARVETEHERAGLDYSEHNELGYPEFQKDKLFHDDK